MLITAADKIIGQADIKSAANIAGKDINPVAAVFAHSAKLGVTGSPGQAGR
jgi:hypothetical protein